MSKQKYVSQLPPTVPLLRPLAPPEHIIKLCKQHQKNTQKQCSKNNKNLQIIEEQDYKKLYEEKCQELIVEITRSQKYEQAITTLQTRNSELEIQVRRMQEQRWSGYDYSRISARGRSKSQKRVVPIIQVKLPVRENAFAVGQAYQQKAFFTEREHFQQKTIQYQREIQECHQQIRQLRSKMKESEMKNAQTQRSTKAKHLQTEQESRKQKRGQLTHSDSPLKNPHSEVRISKLKTPQIGEFSPGLAYQIQTVKKDQSYAQSVEQQIKKLKNELLYKDLLLNNLRQQKKRENHILQKHLLLSVQESKKMAEQTTTIIERFKNQIVLLWKQLQSERTKNLKFESLFEKDYPFRTKEREQKSQFSHDFEVHSQSLVQLLKVRRSQNLQ